jgi:hypothetical protein
VTHTATTGRLAAAVTTALFATIALFVLFLPGVGAEAGGSITLVGQSPWIDDRDVLTIDLRITGSIDEDC